MRCHTFLAAFGFSTILTLVGIASVNYRVDVSGIYHSTDYKAKQFITSYAKALISSKYGLIYTPFERQVKLELARNTNVPCYILGASPIVQIGLDRMHGLISNCSSLLNLGVSGGSFEDTVTLLEPLAKHSNTTLFIHIPPWFFNYDADLRYVDSYVEEYRLARYSFELPARGQKPGSIEPIKNLINWDYFMRNISNLLTHSNDYLVYHELNADGAIADGADIAERKGFRPDGSFLYDIDTEKKASSPNHDPSTIFPCGSYKVKAPYYNMDVVKEFQDVLNKLKQNGNSVIFLLMPYHPDQFLKQCIGTDTVMATKIIEHLVRKMAKDNGIRVIGSYQPARFGLQATDFNDAIHMNKDSLYKIMLEKDVR